MVEENRWIYWWKTSKLLGDWWRKTEKSRWLVEKTSWPMPRRKNQKVGENQRVGRFEKSNCRAGITWLRISFSCYQDRAKNKVKKLKVQVFLTRLLVLPSFVGLSRFCLVLEAWALGLIIGLTIDGTESISGKVAIDFSGWSQWKVLISLQKCSTAKASSYVFSSLG